MPLVADSDLLTYWTVGLAAAVLVVVIVVVLLVAIWLAARRVLAAAVRCLGAVDRIRQSTLPLWELTTTNQVAAGLLASAASIQRRTGAVATALEATEHQGAVL